jgi:hypothetical protein
VYLPATYHRPASLHQQRDQHAPPLHHQDVVGAARRTRIHDVDPDARLRERGGEPRVREALALASAQQHELGSARKQRLEVRRRERLEAVDLPGHDLALRGDQHRMRVALPVDLDVTGPVCGERVERRRRGGVKLHRDSVSGVARGALSH